MIYESTITKCLRCPYINITIENIRVYDKKKRNYKRNYEVKQRRRFKCLRIDCILK